MEHTNIPAEKAVIAATIISGGTQPAILHLEGSDFTDLRHRTIAAVLRDMIRNDKPIDSITVTGELRARNKLDTPGGAGGLLYVMGLADNPHVIPGSAGWYAEEIRSATRARVVAGIAQRLADMCDKEGAADQVDEIVAAHRKQLDGIPGPYADTTPDDTHDSLETILGEADVDTDWIIPGWLARQERAVIVAGEGVGKTSLLRQLAICLAGGLNPWNGQRVASGQRVLFIDTEVSRDQSRRAYRWISGRIVRPGISPGWKSRIIHKTRNEGGVDITGRDEQWFFDTVERVSPDVLILSPAYKLMRGDPKDDRDVLNLLDVIDQARVKHNAAVLIETHAPHGQFLSRDMRPFGSSVWLRWPEIGIGYQRDGDIPKEFQGDKADHLEAVEWRGAREPRDWPTHIRYGGPRELPWMPTYPDWRPSVDLDYEPGEEAA